MGLYDRDYTQEGSHSKYNNAPQMRFGLPKLTSAVKWLLIINFAVFIIDFVLFGKPIYYPELDRNLTFLDRWLSVLPFSYIEDLQIWRLVTYQFMHGDIMHILFNMLGLYMLGPALESHWGTKKFTIFYLSCGVAGGLFYTLLVAVGYLGYNPLIGASASILGIFAACAILFPHFVVFIIVFPVPIRLAAIVSIIVYIFYLFTRGANVGGHAAHLAGMAAGAIFVFSRPLLDKIKFKIEAGRHKNMFEKQANIQKEVDRILEKVHQKGIHSLTSGEKKLLKEATKLEQSKNRI